MSTAASSRERAGPRSGAARLVALTAAAFLLGAMICALAGLQYRSDPFARLLVADALSYHEWALRIASAGVTAEPVFHQSPLHPLLLAGVYRLASPAHRLLWAGVLQALLVSAAVALLVPLGKLCFGRLAHGVAAAALALLHAPVVFYGLKLLNLPLALATQAAALVALSLARRGGAPWMAALAGAACGIGAAARAEMLLFAPLGAWLATGSDGPGRRPGRRRALAFASFVAGFAAALAPITLHNARRGDAVLVAASGGENLYIGNRRGGGGGHAGLDPRASDIFSQRDFARIEAERASGRSLRASEVSAYWRDRALDEVAADPGAWMRLELAKLGRVLHPGDPTDLYSLALERELYLPLLWLLPLGPWSLTLVGATGAFLVVRRRLRGVAPVIALLAVHLVVLLAFFVDTRLRLPWLFFLTPLGGFAIVECLVARPAGPDTTARRRLAGGLVALLAATIVVEHAVTRPQPRDRVRLAATLSLDDRLDAALDVLAPELAADPPDPYVLDQAGWIYQKKWEPAVARDHYERALASGGLAPRRERQTRTRLAQVLEQLGDRAGAAAQHDAAVAGVGADAGTYYERALFRGRRGDIEGALADLRSAIERDPTWSAPREALKSLAAADATHPGTPPHQP